MDSVIEYLTENCCTERTDRMVPGRYAPSASGREFNVLFLCTRNSARSIMAERAMNRWGGGRFHAFSAGSHPGNAVHPITLHVLKELKCETDGLASKNWNEFARSDSPSLDFVFTLCDRAAAEVCPTWPGQPVRAHWGVRDPVAVAGSSAAKRRAFAKVYAELEQRIRIFTALPTETLERFALEHWVLEIG